MRVNSMVGYSVFWYVCVLEMSATIAAEPYRPLHHEEVLETLPSGFIKNRDELATLRQQLTADPQNHELASQIANRYMKLGNQEGDPRYFGYARAALQAWWLQPDPPSDILRIRAKLKEKDHQYAEAQVDFAKLVQHDPHDVQSWINVVNIHRVLGDFPQAEAACEKLAAFASREAIALARAPLWASTGKAEEAYTLLSEVLPLIQRQAPTAVSWVVTVQAEIARALGREQLAEEHFLAALKEDPRNFYLLRAYADLLIDLGRAAEVPPLLQPHIADEGILLRAAIAAAQQGGDPQTAAELRNRLKDHFQEIRLRESQPHGKFESRFELELNQNPQRALDLAVANWKKQKEISDARCLLEAAVVLKDRAAAQTVVDFLTEHHTQHVVLQRLMAELVVEP